MSTSKREAIRRFRMLLWMRESGLNVTQVAKKANISRSNLSRKLSFGADSRPLRSGEGELYLQAAGVDIAPGALDLVIPSRLVVCVPEVLARLGGGEKSLVRTAIGGKNWAALEMLAFITVDDDDVVRPSRRPVKNA